MKIKVSSGQFEMEVNGKIIMITMKELREWDYHT